MIRGAVQIIGGIPGRYLDPFRIAESQPESFNGYILISYETERRAWDFLLLGGKVISGAARVDESHREPVEVNEVRERFGTLRDRTRVFLFEATEAKLRPFERTLHVVPALKFHVDSLSRKQMVRLIKSVPGTRFVAERVVGQPLFPLIEFLEIRSPDQQIEFELRFRKGLLLLYRMDGQAPEGKQIALPLEEPRADGSGSLSTLPEGGLLADFCMRFQEVATLCHKHGSLISPGDGSEIFAKVPAIVKSASPFRRPRLRRAALEMLGQFYSERYEELREQGMAGKVEACYRDVKG